MTRRILLFGVLALTALWTLTAQAQVTPTSSCTGPQFFKGTYATVDFSGQITTAISAGTTTGGTTTGGTTTGGTTTGGTTTGGTTTAITGPFGSISVLTADGAGKITNGAAVASVNGVNVVQNFTGTYTIGTNCIGTLLLTFTSATGTVAPGQTTTGTTPNNPFTTGTTNPFITVGTTTGGTTTGGTTTGGTTGGTTTGGTTGGTTTGGTSGGTTTGGTTTSGSTLSFGQAVINFVLVGDGTQFFYAQANQGVVVTGTGVRQSITGAPLP